MKRTDLDRSEIERALREEPSITDAARSLGVARRTLQDRMRALGMARGKAGHPTKAIKYKKRSRSYRGPAVMVGVAALVGGVLIGRHFRKT
jgi:IS30 family transposase